MSETSPVALNDFYTVIENSNTNTLDPRENDFILPLNPADYRIQSLPAFGILLVSATEGGPFIPPTLNTPYDGPMHYTPNNDVIGTDNFTYDLINNLAEESNLGVVTITVKPNRPSGPTEWATNLLNNGPLGGPNRIDPSVDRQEAGWAWKDKPDFETLNGWNYNVHLLLNWAADAIDRIDVDVVNLAITDSQTWTIGKNDTTEKALFAGSTQLLNPYIAFKPDAESGTYKWFASDTGNPETEYKLEHPVGVTEDDVLAIVIAHTESTQESGAQSKFFDLRSNGRLTDGQALSIASAQNPNPAQGDLMSIQFNYGASAYYGNGTTTVTKTKVQNYIFTSGNWVRI